MSKQPAKPARKSSRKKAPGPKKYILQTWLGPCEQIALMNFHIELTGKSPIKYDSWKFLNMLEECMDYRRAGLDEAIPALKALSLRVIDLPPLKSVEGVRKYLVSQLARGKMVLFRFPHPDGYMHFTLITHYDAHFDSFRVINAQLLTGETPVEYVRWSDLCRCLFVKGRWGSRRVLPFNRKEGSNDLIRETLAFTKVIESTDPKLKHRKPAPLSRDYLLRH